MTQTPHPHIPFVEFPMDSLDLDKLLPLISKASNGLGRYDGILSSIINPDVLLSPIQANEAILSSKIEGTIASLTEVFEYEAGKESSEDRKHDIKEIINYRNSLQFGKESVQDREISLSLIKELHKILTENVRGGDKTPGQFRTTQNLVGKYGDTIKTARFVPPAPETLAGALDNFEQFVKGDFVDPLLQLAIIHAQFEILHPFNDGNGRLGRMLIPLFLFKKDIIQSPAFYLSEYFEKNNTEYRDRLLAITENGDWQGWCEFFLNALICQAQSNIDKARNIIHLYEVMKQQFTEATHSPSVIGALDAFFKAPIVNSKNFMELANIDNRETANSILRKLKEKKLIIMVQESSGSRPTVYAITSLLAVADGELDFLSSEKPDTK